MTGDKQGQNYTMVTLRQLTTEIVWKTSIKSISYGKSQHQQISAEIQLHDYNYMQF